MKKLIIIPLFLILSIFGFLDFQNTKRNGKKPFFSIKKETDDMNTYYGLFFKMNQCKLNNKYIVTNIFQKEHKDFCQKESDFTFENGIYINKNHIRIKKQDINLLSIYYSKEEIDYMTNKDLKSKIEYLKHQNAIHKNQEIKFNNTEQKIIDAIDKKSNIYHYFDQTDLKSFKIINLGSIGYYESESDIRYIQVSYISECYSNTYHCDNLSSANKTNIETDNYFVFLIKINMNTYDDIEIMNGISVPFLSDWKTTDFKIE